MRSDLQVGARNSTICLPAENWVAIRCSLSVTAYCLFCRGSEALWRLSAVWLSMVEPVQGWRGMCRFPVCVQVPIGLSSRTLPYPREAYAMVRQPEPSLVLVRDRMPCHSASLVDSKSVCARAATLGAIRKRPGRHHQPAGGNGSLP